MGCILCPIAKDFVLRAFNKKTYHVIHELLVEGGVKIKKKNHQKQVIKSITTDCQNRWSDVTCSDDTDDYIYISCSHLLSFQIMHDEVSETENIRKNLSIERMIVEGCDILLDVTQTFVRQGEFPLSYFSFTRSFTCWDVSCWNLSLDTHSSKCDHSSYFF